MAEQVIKPDLDFVKGVIAAGGESFKKCYQCAACSGICPLSPDEKPFPRKEMAMAQWGMKEELLADPAIWLCHNCNDCSKYCPRGARPGDLFSALRKKLIQEYAFPRFMGNIVSEVRMLPIALAIPLIIFLIVLGLTGKLMIPEGEIIYSQFFPIRYIEVIFLSLVGLAGLSFIVSLKRFWGNLNKEPLPSGAKGFVPSLLETVIEFLKHSKFSKCEPNADRRIAHLLVFYGFVGLLITTAWITLYYYALKIHSPIPLSDPIKWFGNLSALGLLGGSILIIANRLKDKGINTKSSSFDWTFAIIILLVAITGILTELIRLANVAVIAYPMYLIHLILVFYVIIYFPYSKLAHMFYRIVAIAYVKQAKWDVEV